MAGLRVGRTIEVHEPYVDNEQVFITSEQQLIELDEIFRKFEGMSGAILNRDMKTKILGLGKWKEKEDWVLPWIQTVKKLKSLGFIFTSNFKETVKLTWPEAVEKMRKVALTWSARVLPTLQQRVDVCHTFLEL